MVKHCPQLGSTWPRSVHFWKVKLTYFPVICQYLTLIWQEKKAFGTAFVARSGVCFLSASSDGTLSETISFCIHTDSERLSGTILMGRWRLSVVIISRSIWRTAVQWQKQSAYLAGLEVLRSVFAQCTLKSLILELSIIYIKNDLRIIYQFISITISDMLDVRRCEQWQLRMWGGMLRGLYKDWAKQ